MIGVIKVYALESWVEQVVFVFSTISSGEIIDNLAHDSYLLVACHLYKLIPHGGGDNNEVYSPMLTPVAYAVEILHVVVYIGPILAAVTLYHLLGSRCHGCGVELLGGKESAPPPQAVAVGRSLARDEVFYRLGEPSVTTCEISYTKVID